MSKLSTQNRVTEAELFAVPEPAFTKSWHPLSHEKVITSVVKACGEHKLKIGRREYGATKDMKRFFGVLEIENGHKEFNFSVGLRHAIDKTMSIGVCAGKRTFVCDNLMFSSDTVVFRKHTGQLSVEELTIIASEAIKAVLPQFDELHGWHAALMGVGLTASQAALLTVAAMKENLFPPSKYPQFHDLYYANDTKYTPTLHGWHGAITEMYQERTLVFMQEYDSRLKRFIDYETPVLLKQGKTVNVDFEAIEEVSRKSETERKEKNREASRVISGEIRTKAQEKLKAEKAKKAQPKGKGEKKTTATAPQTAPKTKKKPKAKGKTTKPLAKHVVPGLTKAGKKASKAKK